jgi:tetratricopeptide (TPR) repeat protein
LRSRAILAGSQGKFQEAVEQLRHLTATNRAEAVDWNNLAWDELFVNPVPDDVLSNAQRAATLSQNNDAGILHTLCVALAAAGKPGEARSVMLQTMDLMALDEPDGAIWLAFGRIAQECGENETALAAYRKVKAKQREGDDTTSNYRLAQRWLKLLADSPVNQ